MAGKKGRSGRPAVHGAYVAVKEDPAVRKWLKVVENAIVNDLGGYENVSNLQQLQIHNALRDIRILNKIDKYISDNSVIDNKGDVLPVLKKTYLAYINSLSRIFQSLGLNNDSKRSNITLEKVIDEIGNEQQSTNLMESCDSNNEG